MDENPSIYIVEDDEPLRDSLAALFESEGFDVSSFASAKDFLAHYHPDHVACLVLDLDVPASHSDHCPHRQGRSGPAGAHAWPGCGIRLREADQSGQADRVGAAVSGLTAIADRGFYVRIRPNFRGAPFPRQ
jgi:CheY-like chemotaxis protein